MKKETGITLIALVITIIILLILAGVSIAMLTGDNGILTKVTNASEENRGAGVEEAIRLWKAEKIADNLSGTVDVAQTSEELLQGLKEQGLLIQEECEKLLAGESIKIGTRTITLGEEKTQKTLVQAFKDGKIKIGDYVNYSNPSSGEITLKKEQTGYDKTQTYEVDSNTTWRILGLNESGKNLILISGSPIKRSKEDGITTQNPYFIFGGVESYINSESTLDSICAIYKNNLAQEARSIRAEDITTALQITIDKENNKAYKKNDLEKFELSGFEGDFKKSYTYISEDYAPENYMKAIYPDNVEYKNLSERKVGEIIKGTGYKIKYNDSNIVDKNSTIYDVLFSGTEEDENFSKSYWIPSTQTSIYEEPGSSPYAYFGPGTVSKNEITTNCINATFTSFGSILVSQFAVRPVVVLKSGVTEENLQLTTGSEQEWNTDFQPDNTIQENQLTDSEGKVAN